MFEELAYYLQFDFVKYAIVVGILTALCASLIGVPLVLKRYSLIGDGLSHVAFSGMCLAVVVNLANNLLIVMPLTVITSVFLLSRGNRAKVKGDAALAMLSVGALAIGYFIINTFTNGGNVSADVCASLFGSTAILTLTVADVWISVIVSILVISMFLLFYNKIFAITFDANFMKATGTKPIIYEIMIAIIVGVVVAISMRLVGSLLTSALIIFPPVSAMRLFKTYRSVTICSLCIALFCSAFGIMAAILLGTPIGSTIVITNLIAFGSFYIFGLLRRRAI